MSVHDCDYDSIRKLAGIPLDEPIFILRGQDDLAHSTITRYALMARSIEGADIPSQEWLGDLQDVANEFGQFRMEHPERLKTPD